MTEFAINQRLKARNFYGQENKINLYLVDENINLIKKTLKMSGISESYNFLTKTKPLTILLDPEEKIADATVDNYKLFNEGTFYVNSDEQNLGNNFEDIILLYRPDEFSKFEPVKAKQYQYDTVQGIFIVHNLKFGQYVAGVKK